MKKILVAGGTGLIGTALLKLLTAHGYQIHLLSRSPNKNYDSTIWNPMDNFIDKQSLPKVDAIINLAGSGIAEKRWTNSRKNEIIQSRVTTNKLIQEIISENIVNPEVYISASAIGIYGNRPNEILVENSSFGKEGFLVQSVMGWENAIKNVSSENLQKVIIRIGLVLSNEGGALPKLTQTARLGLVPYFGNGQQMYSWIHIDDLASVFLYALENYKIDGIVNAVAPQSVTNEAMCRQILQSKSKPNISFGVPAWVLRIALGEMADVVLTGADIKPKVLLDSGFEFKYPNIKLALNELFHDKK